MNDSKSRKDDKHQAADTVAAARFFDRVRKRICAAPRWVKAFTGMAVMLSCMFFVAFLVVFATRPSANESRQSSTAGLEQQPKRLVIFLDGTWNTVHSNTNVWRMQALCAPQGSDGKPQLVYYSIGVNGFLGGLFGQGTNENILSAYEWLVENYNPGDDIFIFGFSRGAYAARALAGLVAMDGILKPGSPIGIGELYNRYKNKDATIWKLNERLAANPFAKFTIQEQWLLRYSQPVKIKFVGVWDTVGSIGWAKGDIPDVSRATFDYLQTGLRIHILNAYHALAIDEHRADFEPTLWSKRLPKDAREIIAPTRPISSVEQRWFVGAHANVGGGYPTDLLAQIPLLWMMRKAEVHGLTFRSKVELDGDHLGARVADSYGDFASGLYMLLSFKTDRVIGQDPEVRDDGTHINVNETIDATVFERWRSDPTYRPASLVEWAERKKVNPSKLRATVRADNPLIVVPDIRVDVEASKFAPPVEAAASGTD